MSSRSLSPTTLLGFHSGVFFRKSKSCSRVPPFSTHSVRSFAPGISPTRTDAAFPDRACATFCAFFRPGASASAMIDTFFPARAAVYSSSHLSAALPPVVAHNPRDRAVSTSFSPSTTSTSLAMSTSGRQYSTRRTPVRFPIHRFFPFGLRCLNSFGSYRIFWYRRIPFSSQ